MLGDDDMAVFFSADFCTTWTRLVGADSAVVQFAAIYGVQDVDALQGYALGAEHELCYATDDVDLCEGQLLQQQGQPAVWRVRKDPVRGADGLTSTVLLGKAPE